MKSPGHNQTIGHAQGATAPAVFLKLILALMMSLVLASCGEALADAGSDGVVADEVIADVSIPDVVIVDAAVEFEPSDERGADPFAPVAAIAECEPETLIEFLASNPLIASAWADAGEVGVDEIAATIRSLEPAILDQPTRVTNHGYRSGSVRAFQATLAEGTAVLLDDQGVARVRCACGNPLAEPRSPQPPTPDEPIDQGSAVPVTTTTMPPEITRTDDFCTVWAGLAPLVVGGPSDASPAGVEAYLDVMAEGFGRLLVAGENTVGFPSDALADLEAYHADLVVAAATGTPGEGDVDLRDRIEDFLLSYCGRVPLDVIDDTVPTHLDPPVDPVPDESAPSGNCGSMQFFLLVAAADGLGLDHSSVSDPYLAALDAVLAGTDPGPSFDVADLSPMLAYEEVGCVGAQAMQQLFADAGLAHLIEGTELGA